MMLMMMTVKIIVIRAAVITTEQGTVAVAFIAHKKTQPLAQLAFQLDVSWSCNGDSAIKVADG